MNQNKKIGHPINYSTSFYIILLLLFGCDKLNSVNCNISYLGISKQYVESEKMNPHASFEVWSDSMVQFELSIGSMILFYNNDTSTYYSSEFYNILNPKDSIPYDFYRDCSECILGDHDKVYLLALRAKKHPFIKEVAIFGGGTPEYYVLHFYMHPVIDKLIPDSIQQKYNAPYDYEAFICYNRNLQAALDSIYHTVDSNVSFKKHPKEDKIDLTAGKYKETAILYDLENELSEKTKPYYEKYKHDFQTSWWTFQGWDKINKQMTMLCSNEYACQTRAIVLEEDQYPYYSVFYQDTFFEKKDNMIDFMPEKALIIETISYKYKNAMFIKNFNEYE